MERRRFLALRAQAMPDLETENQNAAPDEDAALRDIAER
jgi:hypothetical protein